MSGVKRISLTPLASTKKVKVCPKTHRFELALPESTEQSCPEFNFADLLSSVTQKKKEVPGQNGHTPLDPYAEDDEDQLRAMAKKFEEKYGVVPTKKKKSKRKDECVDLGAGYDETDPFIDNTDAYDEVVPTALTTAHGGFYINSGALEFKAAEEGSGSDSSSESSSESESDSESDRNSNRNEPTSRKRRMIESDDETSEPEVNGKEADTEEAAKKAKVEEPASTKKPVNAEDPKLKILKAPAAKESLKSDSERESAKAEDKRTSDSGSQSSDSSSSDSSDSSSSGSESSSSSSSEDEADDENKVPEQENTNKDGPTQLPILPAELQVLVDGIKKAATLSAAGKCRFFSPEVNSMLLKIELESRQLSCSKRQAIYNHLENFLPCTKHTLLKRAKNLVIEEVEGQIKPAIKKLQAAVERVIPGQIERHASECQRLAEANPDYYAEFYRYLWDPDLEPAGGTDDEAKKNGAAKNAPPRRKFEWNQEIKSLLNKAVYLKAQCFQWSKLRKESGDEYITRFLDAEIKTLWPKGWMSTKILLKESKGAWEPIADGKKLGQHKLAPLAASLSEVLPKPSPTASGPSQGIAKSTSSATPPPVAKTPTAAPTAEKSAASTATHPSKSATAPAQTPKVSAPSAAVSFTPKSSAPLTPVAVQSNPALEAGASVSSTPKETKRTKEKVSTEASLLLNLKSDGSVKKQQQDRPVKPAHVDDYASAVEPLSSTKREGPPSTAGVKGDFPEKPLLFVKNDELLKAGTKPDTQRQNSTSSVASSMASVVESGVVDLPDSPGKAPEIIDMSRSSDSDACDRELSLQRDLAQVMEVLTNFGGETGAETKKQDLKKPFWNFTETATATQPRSAVASTPPSASAAYKTSSSPKLPSPSPKYSSACGSESFTPPAAHSSSRGQSYFANNSNHSSPSPERRKMEAPIPAHQQQTSVPPAAHQQQQQHSSSSSGLSRSSLMRGFTPPGGSNSSSSTHRANSYHSIDSLAQTSRLTTDNYPSALSRQNPSSSQQGSLQQPQQQHPLTRIDPVYSNFPTISKNSSSRTTPAQAHTGYGFFNQSGVVDGLADVSSMLHAAEFGVDLTFFQSSGSGQQHHS